MKESRQLQLNLEGGRQLPPSPPQKIAVHIEPPAPRIDQSLEHAELELLVNGFLFTSACNGIVGPRDLSELKILFDRYADAENVLTVGERELSRELSERGIAHGERVMQPYETGYETAVQVSGSPRPQVIFFVMPPAYPIRLKNKGSADQSEEQTCVEQAQLLPGPMPEPGTGMSS